MANRPVPTLYRKNWSLLLSVVTSAPCHRVVVLDVLVLLSSACMVVGLSVSNDIMNIAHPVMVWLYNQYLAKLGEVSPPGDACRTRFELSLLHPAVLKKLAEHYKIQ